MLNDLESNILQEDNPQSTSDKFPLKKFVLPGSQQNINILAISTSKRYIYIVTQSGDRGAELLRIESDTLKPIQQAYSIRSTLDNSNTHDLTLTKIWTDRCGNHTIIRHCNHIYYFNSNSSFVKELNCLRGVEVYAVAFDERNENPKSTGNFLVTDFYNHVYEVNINVEFLSSDIKVEEVAQHLTEFKFSNWDNDDDDEIQDKRRKKDDLILGIRFFRATKQNSDPNEDVCYIVAVTKSKFYQFFGPGASSFRQLFGRFERNPSYFNDCCKYFPETMKKKNDFVGGGLDILYRTEQRNIGNNQSQRLEVFNQFGWKTESGYCYGNFTYKTKNTGLPDELKNFIVVPFAKITSSGSKETNCDPISAVHTLNHVFILYKDCLTVISKLTCNIVHTQYFQTKYTNMVYDDCARDGGVIFLTSNNSLYQVSLKDENKDIWQDYVEIGDYEKAVNLCGKDNPQLERKINRICAENLLEKNEGRNAATKYSNSDERFETVCLKFLMKNDIEALKIYLELYLTQNTTENDLTQRSLIYTWLIEIYLNMSKNDKKKNLEDFRGIIREYQKFIDKDTIYQLLESYGKMDEYIEFASLMGDYEKAIVYYINEGQIDKAIDKLTWFASFSDDKETLDKLSTIFLDNSHVFFKKKPKESIMLLQQRFKKVKMEKIVQAIMSTTDKNTKSENNEINQKIAEQKIADQKDDTKNDKQAILLYLKSLVEGPKVEEENNIHNLYIFYLSKSKNNQTAIIEYLKGPLKKDTTELFNQKKKEVLFQLDYAKKLFFDNKPAYCLVLALMGKFSDAVREALEQNTPECNNIAEFIASNAPFEKLRKKLWIDIFSRDSKSGFNTALSIMKKSNILKIEDVLPHITDSIKIEEFKKQISNCINEYEDNINKLKKDICDYNTTAENIKNDIYKVKKKSMEIQYSSCKCEICQSYIKDKNIYLFPCGHMFDSYCIRDTLLNYQLTGLTYLKEKNIRIDELFYDLGLSTKQNFRLKGVGSKLISEEEEDKKVPEKQQNTGGIFNKIMNIKIFDKQESPLANLKDERIQSLKNELNNILSEQCVLCGDYMVDSIQCSLDKKREDKKEADKENAKNEDNYVINNELYNSDWDLILK